MARAVPLLLLFTWAFFPVRGEGQAKQPDWRLPRLKPLSEKTIAVKPWEVHSVSPFGGSRQGGADQRGFALSPDGRLIAGEDGGGWQLELWDTVTGKSLGRFGRIEDPVAMAFSPDGKYLITASPNIHEGGSVELWDIAARKRVRSLDEDVNVVPFTAVAFSPDGNLVALGAGTGRHNQALRIHFWDLKGNEVRVTDGPVADPSNRNWRKGYDALAFAPDGKSLAVLSDRRVFLWELGTGRERCLLGVLPPSFRPAYLAPSGSLAFSPDGRLLAAGGNDGSVRLWNVVSGQSLLSPGSHAGGVRAVRFAPDGKQLWSFGVDNKLSAWSVADAAVAWKPSGPATPRALDALWEDLGGRDSLALDAAVRILAALPDQAVPLLRERLKPVPRVDSERIAQLVAGLNNPDFNARKRAAAELRQLGDLALPALHQSLDKTPNDISRRILQRVESEFPTPEQMRGVLALQILERIGNADSRQLLEQLGQGAPEALLTREARDLLSRWPKAAVELPFEALWANLGKENAREAFSALRAFAARKADGVPFLADQVRRALKARLDDDPKRVAKLIASLDATDFNVRETATRQLKQLGKLAEPALKEALQTHITLETKRRMETLLRELDRDGPSLDRLQLERAVETLERIGTPAARQTLQALTQESGNHWFRELAAAAARRMKP